MVDEVLYSSKSGDWETPQDLFDELNEEFGFTIDVAATRENTKVPHKFLSISKSGLLHPWLGTVWCNPPYGRDVGQWLKQAEFWSNHGATVVMLLPARTDTKWFHKYVNGKTEVRFLNGRLKFGNSKNSAPFPSMIVIWKAKYSRTAE